MKKQAELTLPIGTQALILSKLYYGALSKSLERLDIERYYSVLVFIYHNNSCCQQDICNDLRIDKTAMVKVLDYLSKAGCIERKVNPKDRREHFISLSKKGSRYAKEIVRTFDHLDEKSFAGISESDRKTFNRVLGKVSENLKELPSNDLFFNYKKTQKP